MNKALKKIILAAQLVLIALISFSAAQAAGEVDPSFNTSVGRLAISSVSALAVQPDGKIIIGGSFTRVGGQPHIGLAQLCNSNAGRTLYDYDGDGRANIAVFRPSTGAWYLLRSTQGFTGVSFGDANDKPIPNAYVR